MILDNLRSAWNVGSIFRTAAALNYHSIALCGVTITPPSDKLRETSRGMEEHIPWKSYLTTMPALIDYRKLGFKLVALEACELSKPIQNMATAEKVVFILGNEAMGVTPAILEACDDVIQLPLLSAQSSINVSCAFAAAAYYDVLRNHGDV